MRKSFVIWIIAAVAGVLLLLLLNTSPLSRLGLTVELPVGWHSTPAGAYHDSSCNSRRSEGIPFAFKRPNEFQTCAFDTNQLALLLNGAVGMGLGLCVVAISGKRQADKGEKKG